MENEEKKGCCEGKENCAHGMHGCCHNWKKCHMMRKVIMIVVIIIAFCLGSQWGEMKGEFRNGNRFERGGMMNWGGGRYDNFYKGTSQEATGEVTVKVSDTPDKGVAPVTPKQ